MQVNGPTGQQELMRVLDKADARTSVGRGGRFPKVTDHCFMMSAQAARGRNSTLVRKPATESP